jgi:glycosyltransferase involved in cell wall biosynthesis
MGKQRIILVGSQNLGGVLDDGETMKNYMLAKGFEKCGCHICRIDMRHRPQRFLYLAKYLFCLLYFRNSKIVMSASPLVADKLFRLSRLLGWSGNNEYYWVIGGTFGTLIVDKRLSEDLYRPVKQIVVEGECMKEQLESVGFSNVMVLPNMKEISYVPKKEINERKDIHFVFLSRVMPEKGVDYIIEASRTLVSLGINYFSVDIYGRIDPKYKEILDEKLQKLPNVKYKGFLNLHDKVGYDILSSYDMMLFPTYWHGEGFPGILIDAFIAGLPVIASDWNLNKYLIKNGVNGLIIPPHDSIALSQAMKNVIEGKFDLKIMSANAQKECFNYDLNNIINTKLLKELNIL